MATGDLVKLGTLYINNAKRARPQRPWYGTPNGTYGSGDILPAQGTPIEIKDTDTLEDNQLYWREVIDGGKRLLISDRVIAVDVSYNELNSQGLIFGKVVSIDGKYYKLRSLTGGDNYRVDSNEYSGGKPASNEWDRIINNEGGIVGLPTPRSTDLDTDSNSDDYRGSHNQFWNWYRIGTIVQETFTGNTSNRVYRGKNSTSFLSHFNQLTRFPDSGFRPVLEETTLPPGTVTPNNYSTLGNGGRKFVQLLNGISIAAVIMSTSRIFLYKSTNDGKSWSLLKEIVGSNVNDVALVSMGNEFGILFPNAISFRRLVEFNRIDSNGNVLQTSYTDDNQDEVRNVSLSINSQGTKLIGSASTKNPNYTGFNIRNYEVLIHADGSIGTWAVKQRTFNGYSDSDFKNPSTITHENSTYTFFENTKGYLVNNDGSYNGSSSSGRINVIKINGTTQTIGLVFGSPTSHLQFSPSGASDKDGVIAVAWHGYDTAHPSTFYIRFSKSLNEGVTWSTMQKLVPGKNASFTVDKNNKYVITYEDNGVIKRITSTDKGDNWSTPVTIGAGANPSSMYDNTFAGQFGTEAPTIYQDTQAGMVKYFGSYSVNNAPIVTLTSPNSNQTLYENDTLNITGEAYDSDKDQSVTVYYQINNEPRKVLATNLSQTQISLSKQLTFKGSKLFDGEVAITGVLADGVANTLKVWAVDSEGGQSTTVERTFYVVPNRAPLLAIDAIAPSGIIDTDKFTISGTSGDPDANANVKVSYRINAGNTVDIYDGTGGAWEFELLLAQLKVGENTIVVEVVDNYGAKTSKTIKLNKNTVNTPILQSVARHKISPPKGSARGVLIWVQRDEDLDLTVELSMTLAGEQEQYILLEADPDNIVEVSEGIVEDEYYHETVEPKDNIILKLTTSRANVNIDNKIYLIWGVLE